jgi:hypothetical protein
LLGLAVVRAPFVYPVVSLLLFSAACGNVVVDDTVGSGGANAGAGTGAGAGAGGGGPAAASCTDYCDADQICIGAMMGDSNDLCLFDCEYGRSNAAGCVGEYDAIIACAIASLQGATTCPSADSCTAQQTAYATCILHGPCDEEMCTVNSCTRTCGGVTYQSQCQHVPSSCSCIVNGATLGSCQPPGVDGSLYLDTDLTVGCCAPIFQASQ